MQLKTFSHWDVESEIIEKSGENFFYLSSERSEENKYKYFLERSLIIIEAKTSTIVS